jgi:hypothetical protein
MLGRPGLVEMPQDFESVAGRVPGEPDVYRSCKIHRVDSQRIAQSSSSPLDDETCPLRARTRRLASRCAARAARALLRLWACQ